MRYEPLSYYNWYKVRATKKVFSDCMQYEASVDVDVYTRNSSLAMQMVRKDFPHWHLEVL